MGESEYQTMYNFAVVEQYRQQYEAVLDEYASLDPEGFEHYAASTMGADPVAEVEAEEQHGEAPQRPATIEGAIRDMLSEDRARRAAA